MADRLALIDAIEAAIHQDVGRNIGALFAAARGGLRGAVAALADCGDFGGSGTVGLITGFYVPGGDPPAAETDGPVAVALLVHALRRIGMSCRVCTDEPCAAACRAALSGLADVPVDVVPLGDDISFYVTLLDDLFLAGPWDTIAIGDGGNEIGMGALPASVIHTHIAHGSAIACVTPARYLIVAGVSHWGAYALIGGLAVARADWLGTLLACLDPALDQAILEATVRDGPAVDGVTRRQTLTIDSLDSTTHHAVLEAIRMLVWGAEAG